MSNYLTELSSVAVKKYPREALISHTRPIFRCYQSTPATATIQLRAEKTYTTAAYVDAAQLREIIDNLEKIYADLVSPMGSK